MPLVKNGKKRGPDGTLVMRTRILLHESAERGVTLPDINAKIGVSFYWLRSFKDNKLRNPSANTVQALYEFLSGTKLRV